MRPPFSGAPHPSDGYFRAIFGAGVAAVTAVVTYRVTRSSFAALAVTAAAVAAVAYIVFVEEDENSDGKMPRPRFHLPR